MRLPLFLIPLALFWAATSQGAAPAKAEPFETETEPAFSISYSAEPAEAPALPAAQQDDLWARMRGRFALGGADEGLTRRHEQWFASRPDYLRRTVERSQLYLFHVVEEVEKRGMPMEVALLPMIESAYNPQAVSPQKASGIWQFIPSTGKLYGLQQNAWYDGRKDVLAATRAALDYLQKLHGIFGDWQLALAAYNCGDGCVRRAMQRNQIQGLPTDYASLSLPAETRNYVPKLLAVRNIVQDPARFGVTLASLPNEPYFTQITLREPMEARAAAKLAEMKLEDFLALNPGFHRRVIYTDTSSVLLLPHDKADAFRTNLARSEDRHTLRPYQATRGEVVSKIAAKFGVTLQWLQEHNPLAQKRGKIASTQTLVVPAAGAQTVAMASAVLPEATTSSASKRPHAAVVKKVQKPRAKLRTHKIRRGDTLTRVAKRYKVSVSEIRRVNQAMAEPLRPGQLLSIPQSNS